MQMRVVGLVHGQLEEEDLTSRSIRNPSKSEATLPCRCRTFDISHVMPFKLSYYCCLLIPRSFPQQPIEFF